MNAQKRAWAACMVLLSSVLVCRGEAMLEIFQVSWNDVIQEMPACSRCGFTVW